MNTSPKTVIPVTEDIPIGIYILYTLLHKQAVIYVRCSAAAAQTRGLTEPRSDSILPNITASVMNSTVVCGALKTDAEAADLSRNGREKNQDSSGRKVPALPYT